MKIFVQKQDGSYVIAALHAIICAIGCEETDDIENADRVLTISPRDALSLLKQTDAPVDILIMPGYNAESDRATVDALAYNFPGRAKAFEVVGLECGSAFTQLMAEWMKE